MRDNFEYPKPRDWDMFEQLCTDLIRDEWNTNNWTRHGRQGQPQNGVDISGYPDGAKGYIGIQCKKKAGDKQLTEAEIKEEVQKAEGFVPELAEYHIYTSADSDAEIQKIVRLLDVEHRKQGKFPIYLKSWDDICGILDNKHTIRDNYLHGIGLDKQFDAIVTFGHGARYLDISPNYYKTHYEYAPNKVESPTLLPPVEERINKSYCLVSIWLENVGVKRMTQCRIELEHEIKCDIFETNVIYRAFTDLSKIYRPNNFTVFEKHKNIVSNIDGVNSGESKNVAHYYVKLPIEAKESSIKWKLTYAEGEPIEGELLMKVTPCFDERTIFVSKPGIQNEIQDIIFEKRR